MPTLETLTHADIEQVLTAKSLRRAKGYVTAVHHPQRAGSTLTAQIRGSWLYDIEVQVNERGIHAICTCPYDWGGYCKHIGAVLLKWLQAPTVFAEVEPAVSSASRPADFPFPVIPVDPAPAYQPKELPAWLTNPFEVRHQASLKNLGRWLEFLKMQELRGIAAKRGWIVKGNKKAALAQQLIDQMTDAADTARVLQNLDVEHRRVFWALVLLGRDRILQDKDIKRVAQHFGSLTKYKQITTYLNHLVEMGLVMPAQRQQQGIDFVPGVVLRHCPSLPAEFVPASSQLTTDRPAADLRLADPAPFLQQASQLILMLEMEQTPLRRPMPRPEMENFYHALQAWDYDPPELSGLTPRNLTSKPDLTLTVPPQSPALPDDALQRLTPIVGSAAKLDFMFNLLVTVGIFQPGSPVTVWPEIKADFFKLDEPRQRAVLIRSYFELTTWSELGEVLRRQPELRLRRSLRYAHMPPAQLQVDLANFRQIVLRALACLPDGQWLRLDDLQPLLRTLWPRFDQSRWVSWVYGVPGWFLTRHKNNTPLSPDHAADWLLAQWNFIQYMLTGPLSWLGLVDILYDDDDPVEIRLHGLTDLFFDRQAVVDVPYLAQTPSQAGAAIPIGALHIEEQTVTVNPAAVSAQAHNLLDKIARLDEAQPHRFIYTLDPLAVHTAFESGHTLTELMTDWERLFSQPMPAHIRQQLEIWWQGYGQVRIYSGVTMIEFDDEYALAEMKAVTSLAEHLIAQISPRLVLIPETAVAPLVTELEQAGYTPKQTDKV